MAYVLKIQLSTLVAALSTRVATNFKSSTCEYRLAICMSSNQLFFYLSFNMFHTISEKLLKFAPVIISYFCSNQFCYTFFSRSRQDKHYKDQNPVLAFTKADERMGGSKRNKRETKILVRPRYNKFESVTQRCRSYPFIL